MAVSSNKFIVAAISALVVTAAVGSPLVASAVTANTTINATVNPAITVSSTGTVSLSLTPGALPVESRASDTVTVNTNDTLGYTLTLSDVDTVTNLVSGTNTIGATANTFAVPNTLAANKWGYALAGGNFSASYTAISNETGSTDKWAGMPSSASPQTIKSTSATATNDTTTVWYGVRVDNSQPSAVATPYTDQVVYTATAN